MEDEAVLLETIELLANRGDGDAELINQIPRSPRPVALERGQDRPPGRRHRVQRSLLGC
jgi:hypothetical protein